jgi:hypothetical protein
MLVRISPTAIGQIADEVDDTASPTMSEIIAKVDIHKM